MTRMHPPGHAALRRGRYSEPGRIYLITATMLARRPVFADFSNAAAACRTFAKDHPGFRLLAWVLMPDHAHWLIELRQRHLDQAVWRLKRDVTKALRRERLQAGPIWGRAFHDRALRREEDLKAVARYVILNPVRAGLVTRPGDYPFWDAVWVGDGD